MKKILFFASLILSLVIIVNLITSIYTLWHKQDVLFLAQKQLQQEQKEHQKLQQEFHSVNSSAFVEEEARNKLFMTKPGEEEILIASPTSTPTHSQITIGDTRPYWQQWISVFFH